MGNNLHLDTALVYHLCPICGQKDEGSILINKHLTTKPKLEKYNNKIVGWNNEPCDKCKKLIQEGVFFIIAVDKNKERTGDVVGIKKESEFYKNLPDQYKKMEALFMDIDVMISCGLINREINQ